MTKISVPATNKYKMSLEVVSCTNKNLKPKDSFIFTQPENGQKTESHYAVLQITIS